MPRTALFRTLGTAVLVAALVLVGLAGFGQASSPGTVRVKWGDTLWALSRHYHVDMYQLAAANHMRVTDLLLTGRTLTLPSSTTPGSATPGGAATSDPSAQRSFCATYKPPTGPRGQLPVALASDPSLLTLRPVFARWAAKYRVPVDLMEAEAWQESGWSNDVTSSAGAVGIGQLLPSTAAFVNQMLGANLQLDVTSDNIRMMAAFLGYLLRSTGGDVCQAVAAYYQGLGALHRYGVLPVTQPYVRNVLSLRPRFA